ncbi:MAG: amidohydrolase family protein, partial [Planctomycetota bacterium]|nr:amidohydrolase family protein [Planctomycetota bacterium]
MKLLLPPVLLTIIAASWTPDTTPGSGRQDREVRGLNSHLILHNGKVYTGDSERPWVEAIAIRNGVIEAVGDSKTVKTVAWSSEAMSIDLGGRFACPGFVDAHGHVASLGRTMRSLDLVGTRSFGDVVKRARDRITTLEKGEWVVGRGWDQNDWKEKSFPHHGALSKAPPDHPAWLVRIDGHAGIANDRALEIAGITKEIPDPEGGRIVRDPETGAATGVLVDAAMSLVTRHIPSMEKAQIRKDIL